MTVLRLKLATVLILLSAISTVRADDDDTEFILNIFSDFGPVLALFGDQFARQFASESLTLLDHVIFACVPLGIVTALIGAIRVQGPKFAKAFIGRARENRSTVELELMSSTSDNVCEMFSGRGVVRTLGRPRLKQIIILPDIYNTFQEDLQKAIATSSPNDINHDEKRYTDVDASCGIHTLDTAYGLESSGGHSGRIMEWEDYHGQTFKTINILLTSLYDKLNIGSRGLASAGHDDTPKSKPITKPIAKPSLLGFLGPPNIHLNAAPTKVTSKAKTHELWGSFFFAVIFQLGLIVIAIVTVYHQHTRNSIGHDAKPWGFPCYVGGSVLLFLSMFICSVVVEVSTKELKWTRVNKPGDTRKEDQGQKKVESDQRKSDHSSAVLLNHDDRAHQGQGNKQSGLIDPHKPRVLWIQPQQRINDQAFDPLIYPGGARNHVLTSSRQDAWEIYEPHIKKYTSRSATAQETPGGDEQVSADSETESQSREDNEIWIRYAWELLAVIGVLAGAIGFTIQFIGLRALPWPCAVSQLGATLFMAGVRAFLRRRLGRLPPYLNALPGYELDFLAHQIVMHDTFRNIHYPDDQLKEFEQKEVYDVCQWEVKTPKPRDEKDGCRPQGDQAAGKTLLQNKDYAYPTMELIYVRERLGNLCKWTSSASGPALALSQAIEFFLELFPPASSNLIPWQISGDVGQKGCSTGKAEVFIRRKETKAGAKDQATDSEWAVESGKLEAILSLWLATMESKMMRNVKENAEDGKNQNDWRRSKMAIDQKVSCHRLLGPKNGGILSRDIVWWVGTFLGIEENDNISSIPGADHHRPLDIGFGGDSSGNTELRLPSTGSLPTLASQHLFTCFIWTIVEYLPTNCLDQGVVNNGFNVRVQIPSTLDSHSFSRTWERAQLAHEKLKKFTLYAEKLGLGTTTDILLCVIPAFSSHGLLPNEAILKQLPRIGQGEGAGWVEMAKCYKSLLETRIKKEPPERFTYAIVTRTMDFIELASEPLHSNSDIQELDELRPELKSILQILSKRFGNILSTLSPIYKLQNRQSQFQHIFESYGPDGEMITTKHENFEDFKEFIGFGEYHHKTCYRPEINWRNLLTPEHMMDKRAIQTGDKQRNDQPQVASYARMHVKAMAETDIFGRTPLHYAITFSRADIIKALLGAIRSEDRADYRGVDDCGRAPIHLAAASGNVEILQIIIEDLETGDTESQRTALGAQCLDGLTPLHLAVKGEHLDCVRKLLQCHVPRDAVDIWKRGPMHTAAINRSWDILNELLNKDMRLDLIDNFGKTPLTYLGTLKIDEMPLVQRMMKACEKFNTADSAGNTIMHHAVKLLDLHRISNYIVRGAVVDKADNKGKTPLHLAIEENKHDVADLLLKHGALPLAKDIYGVTPLMLACGQAWDSIVDQMMSATEADSKNVGDKDSKGRTALHYVCDFVGDKGKKSDQDRVQQVVKKLLPAILKGDEQTDFTYPDQDGRTPLHLAALRGWERAVDELLANNIDIGYQDDGDHKALYYAIKKGHSSIFKTLLEGKVKKTNQHGTDPHGEALHMACEAGNETFVDLLIENEMDANWQSYKSGRTPFHEAIYQKQPGIIRKLLEKNTITVRWDLVNHADRTPFELALYDRDYGCITAIMKNTNEEYTAEIGKCFAIAAGQFYALDNLLTEISEDITGITTLNLEILISRLPRSDWHKGIFGVWKDWVLKPENLVQMTHPAHLLARCKDTDHEGLKELVKLVKDKAWEQDEDNWTAVDVADKYDNPALRDFLAGEEYEQSSSIEYRWPSSFDTVQNLSNMSFEPIYEGLQEIRSDSIAGSHCRRMFYTQNCIPLDCTKFYFEVKFLKSDFVEVNAIPFIAVGFSQVRAYSTTAWPGMIPHSWAYHGDDGAIHATGASESYGTGATVSTDLYLRYNDVVGCGMDLVTGESYVTYNGTRLASGTIVKDRNLHRGKVYPLICLYRTDPVLVQVLFKRSDQHQFVYEEANYW